MQGVPRWVARLWASLSAALGGAISFVLSRQQISEARRQRAEQDRRRDSTQRIRTISDIQRVLDDQATAPGVTLWADLNERMETAVRRFEAAARNELEAS